MDDAIPIPFQLDDAKRAEVVMRDIADSFGALEKQVLKLAKADEKSAEALKQLEEQFRKGKISAEQYRTALAQVAGQAPKSAKELERLAKEAQEAAKAAKAARDPWANFKNTVADSANAFNETREAVSSIVETIHGAARGIATLAGEQQQLDRSQQRLGLNFAAAQQAAGRFTSQIDLMRFATYAANRGLILSQQELQNLARVGVAHAASRGKEVGEVFENMVDGIIEGDESLEKLDGRFKQLAGDGHTAGERLRALNDFAKGVAPAADDASSSMDRFENKVRDAGRSFATAFVDRFTKLNEATNRMDALTGSTTDLKTIMEGLGSTIADLAVMAGRGIAAMVGFVAQALTAIPALVMATGSALRALADPAAIASGEATTNAMAAFRGSLSSGIFGDVAQFTDRQVAALEDARDRREFDAQERTSAVVRTRTDGPSQSERERNKTTRNRNNTPQSQVEQAAIEALTRRIEAQRRAMTEARDGLAHANEMEEHGLDVARITARTEVERFQVEAATRRVRQEGLESTIELGRAQIQNLQATREGLETEREHAGSVKMRNTYTDRIRSLHEDEVRLTREIEGHEQARARLAAEGARAEEDRAEALKEAQYAARDAMRDRDHEAEVARRDAQRRMDAEQQSRENGTRLREHFRELANASVDTASVVISAYDQMTQAAASHFEALVLGQETAGEALQGFVSDTLKAFAKIASQQAIFELGKGFAALFVAPQAAAAHFAAAALFGVVAAGAGVAAQATAPSSARGSAASTGSAGRDREAANVSARSSGSGATQNITVVFGGPMYGTGGLRQAGREIAAALNGGAVQGGVQLNPLLVPSG